MKSKEVYYYAIGRGIIATVDQKRFDTPRKIGEKVRIKPKLNDSIPFGLNSEMMSTCGKVVTIEGCRRVDYNYTFASIWSYTLQEIGYSWNEFMFEQEVVYEVE